MKRFELITGLVLCLCGMIWAGAAGAAGNIPVFVSIVPQKYFIEKIGGKFVKVSIMVQAGASPATYEPNPRQMVALSRARIYFALDVPFERVWLKKIASTNPNMLIVHTEAGIEKRPMKADKPGGIKDPHIWLSPPLVKVQARNILSALLEVDPANASVYRDNYKKFIKEIDALDAELKGIFKEKKGIGFMVFHPAWGYFAQAYGLKMVPIESEGKTPRPADLKRLIEKARKQGIKMIFVQPEFSTKNARTIAKAIDGQVAFASPLHPDWAGNLKEVARKFKAALR